MDGSLKFIQNNKLIWNRPEAFASAFHAEFIDLPEEGLTSVNAAQLG